MRKIRVMIVEDSHTVRKFLLAAIEADSRLEVVAAAASAEEALHILHAAAPDVISMDIRLPGMNGFEATQRIMAERPTPIVVVSANVEADDLKVSMNALRAGALTVMEKPAGGVRGDYAALTRRLCTQLVLMSQVKVIRQRFGRGRLPIDGRHGADENGDAGGISPRPRLSWSEEPYCILGIAASTGGPGALHQLLRALGEEFPLPIMLVQHMTPTFLVGFASWLDAATPLEVALAQDGQRPRPGRVYVAPADRHLCLHAGCVQLRDGDPANIQRASATALFQSLARGYGSRCIGVLLTGMGDDGAAGLKGIRDAGGLTIAEDASTSVVDGMPGAARRLGAVCESLPLPQIGRRLRQLVRKCQEAAT